jgi:hypothetical protein
MSDAMIAVVIGGSRGIGRNTVENLGLKAGHGCGRSTFQMRRHISFSCTAWWTVLTIG